MTTRHLDILDDLARDLEVRSYGLQNARRLAKGYEDLVVVLIEPTDKAEEEPYQEMLAASKTLLCINETLQFPSGGERDIENTIILDVRAFRSNFIRTSQGLEDWIRDDDLVYGNLEKFMSCLRPRVVIFCQFVTDEANNKFVKGLCSSIKEAGDVYLQTLPNEHECLFIKIFHPMHCERSKDDALKRVMDEYLLEATFIIALNALAGYRISGIGLKNLRNCAQDGPAVIFAPEGVYVSYHWDGKFERAWFGAILVQTLVIGS
ncbi:uncharacterized protein N7477_009522 [Penicillium maclennaniae]|uniref:uncharacterized protein n=1 Tax=Penicillium maclennaniae TaxID=1343394 RepID=UPI0025423CF8|nr:uncharacterized protein N7477_009522 [Penicillium maclennaniae]KAJ5661906.1 hypothetical protein N7477_009522 [Penicillium maclennaniae]